MENSISKKFTFSSLVGFTIPSIAMLIFTALYSIVDGVFVSRFVSTDALSAVNIVFPFLNVVFGIAIMLVTGGSAIVAKKIGENKTQEAKENFTLIMIVGIVLGLTLSIVSYIFLEDIIYLLGATEPLYQYCMDYFVPILILAPMFIININIQYFAITAGKPNVGLYLTLIGGFTNMILDYVFIVPMDMGIAGAAWATGLGNLIPAAIGLIYFNRKKSSLYFVKPTFDLKVIFSSFINGSSEMVTNLSMGITTMLFNIVMMRYLGSDGVAAMTIVLYGQFLINSVYIGFSTGVAPVISYNYGNKDKVQIKKVFKYCMIFIGISSMTAFTISILGSANIVGVFAEKGSNVYKIGLDGFKIFSLSFIVAGFNIFTSALFTAFSNGKVSAVVSFLRTFVFIVAGIILLPKYLGVNGIWLAIPIAEILGLLVSIISVYRYRNIYGYGSSTDEEKKIIAKEIY